MGDENSNTQDTGSDETEVSQVGEESASDGGEEFDISQLSDEELDAAINKSEEEESREPPKPVAKKTDSKESDEDSDGEEAEEDSETEDGEDEESSSKPVTKEDLDRLVQKLSPQSQQDSGLLQSLSSELQKTKTQHTQITEYRDSLTSKLDELWETNPREAQKVEKQVEKAEQALRILENKQDTITHAAKSFSYVSQKVDFKKVSIRDTAAILKEEGLSDAEITEFLKAPFVSESGFGVTQLFKRAQERAAFNDLKGKFMQLLESAETLLAENKKLKSSNPAERITKKISELSKSTHKPLGKKNGARRPEVDFTDEQLHNLDDADFEALCKQYNVE